MKKRLTITSIVFLVEATWADNFSSQFLSFDTQPNYKHAVSEDVSIYLRPD